MACILTQGYTLGCRDGKGGIKEVLITELDNIDTLTATSGVITAMECVVGKKFFVYSQEIETANAVQKPTGNRANGSFYYEQGLTLVLNNPTASVWNEIDLLAKNNLAVIVLDNNGKYWLFGEINGLSLEPSEGGTGTAFGDRNGVTLVFKGMEPSYTKEVTAALIPALIVPAT